MTSRWGRWRRGGGRASSPDPEQNYSAHHRPISRASPSGVGHLIDHSTWRGRYLVGGTFVLVTGVVVATVLCRPKLLGLAVNGLFSSSVSGTV